MAQQNINIGSSANKGDGDPIRTAFTKVNTNFTELYNRVVVAEGQLGIDNAGGATIQQSIIGSVFADDSTLLIDGANGSIPAANITGTLPALDGSALTNLPAQAFASITGKPTTLAGYGITDGTSNASPTFTGAVDFTGATSVDFTGATITGTSFLTSVPAQSFASLTGKPTTIAGYGITDAFDGAFGSLSGTPTTLAGFGITDAATLNNMAPTGAVDFTGATSVDFTGATITGTSFLTSYTETDPVVGAITGIVKSDGSGNISAAVAGTDYLTTVAFADLTGKPTTLAGYGITDAATLNNMAPTGAVDFTGATTIDFNTVTINNLDYSDISNAPTTLAGYGITDALANVVEDTTPQLGGDLDCQGFNITMDNGIISSSAGNLQISSFNYVTIDSANDGQIEIGRASGAGDVIIGKESNGTSVSFEGVATFDERAKFDKGVEEKFATTNGATGVTALDCATGHVHYLTSPAGDITANFTNLSLTAEYATNITIIIDQGNTQYEVTAVQIGGVAQTIIWQGNSAPTGTANGVDSFSFTILNDGGTYVVLGQMVAFGGV